MSHLVFPYGIRFQEDGRIEVFPMVEIDILGNGGAGIRAAFHIDSGATTSALPASDGEALGFDVERGKEVRVRGILSDSTQGYIHDVVLRFEERKFRVPVIFVRDERMPRILGREGVFSRFAILFDEAKRRTAFLEAKKERKAINALFS